MRKVFIVLLVLALFVGSVAAVPVTVAIPAAYSGEFYSGNAVDTWDNHHDKATSGIDVTSKYIKAQIASWDTVSWVDIERSGIVFNTTSIPDDQIITNVILNVTLSSVGIDIDPNGFTDIVSFTPADPISYVDTEYQAFGNVSLGSSILYSAMVPGSSYNITVSTTLVNIFGYTTLGLRDHSDMVDTPPAPILWFWNGAVYNAYNAEVTAYRPVLYITYDNAYPGSYTGTSNLTFYVQDMTTVTPISGATIHLDGSDYGLPIYSGTTSGAGYYYLPNVPNGAYFLTVGAAGYESHDGSVVVTADYTFPSYLAPFGYITGNGLTFFVQDSVSVLPLDGASIVVDGRSAGLPYFTNTTGAIPGWGYIANVPTGVYLITVSKAGYEAHSGYVTIDHPQSLDTYLRPLDDYGTGPNQVKFVLMDADNQTQLSGASVIATGTGELLNGGVNYNGFTDANGTITFNMVDDYYNIYYSMSGYTSKMDSRFDIRAGQTIVRYLVPQTLNYTHTLIFHAFDAVNHTVIANASIWLTTGSIGGAYYGGQTDAGGLLTVPNVPTGTYQLNAWDNLMLYNDYVSTMTVNGNAVMDVYLVPKTWGILPTPTGSIAIPTWTVPATYGPQPTPAWSGPGGAPGSLMEILLNFVMVQVGVPAMQAGLILGALMTTMLAVFAAGAGGKVTGGAGVGVLAMFGGGLGFMVSVVIGWFPWWILFVGLAIGGIGFFVMRGSDNSGGG